MDQHQPVQERNAASEAAPTAKPGGKILRGIYLTLAILLFNAIVVAGPYFGLMGALIGCWAAGIALFFSGLALFFAALLSPIWPSLLPVQSFATGIGSFFTGIGLAAAGLLLGMGLHYTTVFGYRLTIRYLRFNQRIIIPSA